MATVLYIFVEVIIISVNLLLFSNLGFGYDNLLALLPAQVWCDSSALLLSLIEVESTAV